MTACARIVNSPTILRELLWPRCDQVGFEDRSGNAVDGCRFEGERIDAVAEFERQPSGFFRLAGAALERLDDSGAGAPGHMKPRHRIAVTHGVIAAALRPADHRKNTVSHCP